MQCVSMADDSRKQQCPQHHRAAHSSGGVYGITHALSPAVCSNMQQSLRSHCWRFTHQLTSVTFALVIAQCATCAVTESYSRPLQCIQLGRRAHSHNARSRCSVPSNQAAGTCMHHLLPSLYSECFLKWHSASATIACMCSTAQQPTAHTACSHDHGARPYSSEQCVQQYGSSLVQQMAAAASHACAGVQCEP